MEIRFYEVGLWLLMALAIWGLIDLMNRFDDWAKRKAKAFLSRYLVFKDL